MNHTVRWAATGLIAASAVLAGSGQLRAQALSPYEPPSYSPVLRQEEDWTVLRGFEFPAEGDPFDRIKYIPLTESGDIWLSLGGQERLRYEVWDGFNFNDDNDDDFLLNRLRLHGDLHVGENLRFFVEGKSSLATDRDLPGGQRTLDVDTAALQQAFAELFFPMGDHSLRLRGGRQMLLFGKQRLVSPLDWSNTLRAWDGVSGTWHTGDWYITGFWTYFAPVDKYDFNDTDEDIEFWGVYSTGKVPTTDVGVDLYFLTLDRASATFNGTSGEEERYTVGTRLFGGYGETGLLYDLEGAYQFGEVGAGDVSAWMVGAELAYLFKEGEKEGPRVHVGLDYGSGDDEPGGDVETFNQLFPLGHAYLGYIDVIGRQNIVDLSTGVTVKPVKKMVVALTGHWFWRADRADGLYNAGGALIRAGNASQSREVGQEIDLTMKYQFDRHLEALVGYSHFFPDDFVNESGPGDDIDFAYVQMQFTF